MSRTTPTRHLRESEEVQAAVAATEIERPGLEADTLPLLAATVAENGCNVCRTHKEHQPPPLPKPSSQSSLEIVSGNPADVNVILTDGELGYEILEMSGGARASAAGETTASWAARAASDGWIDHKHGSDGSGSVSGSYSDSGSGGAIPCRSHHSMGGEKKRRGGNAEADLDSPFKRAR